jgi:hypothetical protein
MQNSNFVRDLSGKEAGFWSFYTHTELTEPLIIKDKSDGASGRS